MSTLLVASANPGKLREYGQLLADLGLQLEGLEPDVEEVGETYCANAVLKAEAVTARAGLPALGDDSGLEVEALGGFPGLRSARIAGSQDERNAILFDRLAGHPRPWRARFVCEAALATPGEQTRCFRGERWGEIVEPRDAGFGFGYDPLFLVPDTGKTFAEMEPAEKHRWSHRAAAVQALRRSGALSLLA